MLSIEFNISRPRYGGDDLVGLGDQGAAALQGYG